MARGGLERDADGSAFSPEGEKRRLAVGSRVSAGGGSGAGLGVTVKTIESHRASLMRKLHLRTVADLVRYAVRNGLVEA